jgi:SnoaL-like domain
MESQWIEKLAIQELCARYCHTIDSQDSDGWADCFVEDGAFEFEGWALRGRTKLREYAEVHARHMRYRHMTLNCLYDVSGNRASGRATTVVTLATDAGFKILGQGGYRDELVKQDGRWLIDLRRLRSDYLVSDPGKSVMLADPDVAKLVSHLLEAARRLGQRVGPETL